MGVWIEIQELQCRLSLRKVTPLVGVWIEINRNGKSRRRKTSLPLWECGLKCFTPANVKKWLVSLPLWECGLKLCAVVAVAALSRHSPCGSVDWNLLHYMQNASGFVTPLVGVWIEIAWHQNVHFLYLSLPLWECGLKLIYSSLLYLIRIVTPLVGVWIEIEQSEWGR